MTIDAELAEVISNVRTEILSYGPREQATCCALIEAALWGNAMAEEWSKECEALASDVMAAMRRSDADIRAALVEALKKSGERMAQRLAHLKEQGS